MDLKLKLVCKPECVFVYAKVSFGKKSAALAVARISFFATGLHVDQRLNGRSVEWLELADRSFHNKRGKG